jgi:hypothetical protein
MGSLDWRIDLFDNYQADLQILITLQNFTGTITHKVFNTSTLRCSLYESGEQVCTQTPLRTGLLLLGRTLQYLISSSLFSFGSSLDISWLYADRICNCTLLRYCGCHGNVFRCCVNSLYITVVTETFLYLLHRNRCLCHKLGDMFQQAVTYQWIYIWQ